ncbi:MAG: hypothetical protein KKC76_00155 [Proteobacteria bacterium]|nr:hypothetical protein [Pseudomonadota bacterium]MBU4297505.1 hypothetical protein [Pseudomonadota bacterium]MCG2749723.1 hypothetical protein [Desulfobulbaceae bacterium]
MSYWGYPRYVSVAEKKAKAEKKLKQLQKKNPGIQPVVIEGNILARTWWGKSWNQNLERYADYANRIGRGRSYVRHGAVLDLKIDTGKVTALVQGSTSRPYEVEIKIQAISQANWSAIKKQCEGQLKSLQDLLAGKFPKILADIFFAEEKGLFPSPQAISFDCSCPDWASMCKHVAAALYGIGARFDEDPSLFFKLRGADTGDLITRAVKDKTEELLAKTKTKSAKVIVDADLADIFGIDLDNKPDFAGNGTTAVSKKSAVKKIAKPIALPRKQRNIPKTSNPAQLDKSLYSQKENKDILGNSPNARQKVKVSKRGSKTATGQVVELIVANKAGITIEKLVEKTGYSKTKLYNIVHRLKQQGKIKNTSHGVYAKA